VEIKKSFELSTWAVMSYEMVMNNMYFGEGEPFHNVVMI
jgi:hypothetical protein